MPQNLNSRQHRKEERRIARILDGELQRNEEIGAVLPIQMEDVEDLMYQHHFLWTGVATSMESAKDVVEKLRPELQSTVSQYSASGIMLFVETDKAFTSGGERHELVLQLREIAGGNDVDIAINIRTCDSDNKIITCRAALVGNAQYVIGEVYEDFGQYEMVLYKSDNKDEGHLILAFYSDDEFTLARYDWGKFEYNRSGRTDDCHHFDKDNTKRLCDALHVRRPKTLLKSIRRRFAARFPENSDSELLGFCHKKGIEFNSDFHY